MQQNEWLWVDTSSKAEKALEDVENSPVIGIDTEYDSFRYFRDKLCLIQVKAKRKTYLFDPLGNIDLSFLGKSFAASSACKIMHAGDNDIRILKRDYGFFFSNTFDTHRAASLLGCSHLSLAALVERYLGIGFEKNKKIQRSKWDIRPLTEEQLEYAAMDTAYLPDLYHTLEAEIIKAGLETKAVEAFAEMTKLVWREKELDQRGHKKIGGYRELPDNRKERLKRLFRWRYLKAKAINRAFFLVLSDKDLFFLSGMEIGNLEDLADKGLLSQDKIRFLGHELVEILSGKDVSIKA
jgi:ribonuclease D